MTSSLVSIIIPCYNHAHYLKEAIESVLASTYENVEIIVVNDGSTSEESIEIFKKFSMPKTKIIHQDNQGPSTARNTGIKNANGKYILPLDADDKINKNYIRKAVELLENNENIGIVGPKTELFGAQQGVFELSKYKFPDILTGNCLVCSCMYRFEDWQKIGGYNSNMTEGWEDWDFWLSLIELGREVHQFNEVMFYYRIHDVSRNSELVDEKKTKMTEQLIKNHIDLYLQNKKQLISLLAGNIDETTTSKKLKRYRKLCNIFIYISIALFISVIALVALLRI